MNVVTITNDTSQEHSLLGVVTTLHWTPPTAIIFNIHCHHHQPVATIFIITIILFVVIFISIAINIISKGQTSLQSADSPRNLHPQRHHFLTQAAHIRNHPRDLHVHRRHGHHRQGHGHCFTIVPTLQQLQQKPGGARTPEPHYILRPQAPGPSRV